MQVVLAGYTAVFRVIKLYRAILFSFGLPVCNARPIYIYNMDLKKSLIIENLYNSNREV